MKNKIVLVSVVVSFCIIASGCSNLFSMLFEPIEQKETAETSVQILLKNTGSDDSSRVIAPPKKDLAVTLTVTKTAFPSDSFVINTLEKGETGIIIPLEEGVEYRIDAQAITPSGAVLLSGTSTGTPKKGENIVVIDMGYTRTAGGKGSLLVQYKVSADIGKKIRAELIPLSGGDTITCTAAECVYDENTSLLTVKKADIPSGTYIFSLIFAHERGDMYLNIDPVVEIADNFESGAAEILTLNSADFIKAGNLYYVADAANTTVKAGNSGLYASVPVTLETAVMSINSNPNVSTQNPAKIVLLENVSYKTPMSPDYPGLCFVKDTIVTSAGSEVRSITLAENVDIVFIIGIDTSYAAVNGIQPVSAHVILENIIVQGVIKDGGDVDNTYKTDGTQNAASFDDPLYYAASGLVGIYNGKLTLAKGSMLQNNALPLKVTIEGTTQDSKGAGVKIEKEGSLTLDGGTIRNCTAAYGGGVYVSESGSIEFISGKITENANCYTIYSSSEYLTYYPGITYAEYLTRAAQDASRTPNGGAVFFYKFDKGVMDSASASWDSWFSALKTVCVNNMHKGPDCAATVYSITTEAALADAVKKTALGGVYAEMDSGSLTITLSAPLLVPGSLSLVKKDPDACIINAGFTNQSDPMFNIVAGNAANFERITFTGSLTAGSSLMRITDAFVTLKNCTFNNNYITGDSTGGALTVQGTKTELICSGVTVQNCRAHRGGGLFVSGGTVVLNNSAISNCSTVLFDNKGGLGGGIFTQNSTLTYTGSSGITMCSSAVGTSGGGEGGGMYIGPVSSVNLFTSLGGAPLQNTAEFGGGVYIAAGGRINLYSGANFLDNTAVQKGSKLFIQNYSLESMSINGTTPSDFSSLTSMLTPMGFPSAAPPYINDYLYSGDGSSGNPYLVKDASSFNAMRYVPTDAKYFSQTTDFSMFTYSNFDPIPLFKGIYNGNLRKITTVQMPSASAENSGLFGTLQNAEVRNLFLEGATIASTGTTLKNCGILAGLVINSTVERCGATGDLSINLGILDTNSCTGGLIGKAEGSIIRECFSAMGFSALNIQFSGGLVGWLSGGSIEDCYTSMLGINASVSPGLNSGTLVGKAENSYSINRAHSIGRAFGSLASGFIGSVTVSNIPNTFMYGTTTGSGSLGASNSNKTPADLVNQATFGPYAFGTVWNMDPGKSFPYLAWHEGYYVPQPLRVTSIVFKNEWVTAGSLEQNDTIVITFSSSIDPVTIQAGFTAGTSKTLGPGELTLNASTSSPSLTFTGSGAVNIGSFTDTTSVSNTASCDVTSMLLDINAKILTLTFGTPTGNLFASTSSDVISFTPSSAIKSESGVDIYTGITADITAGTTLF